MMGIYVARREGLGGRGIKDEILQREPKKRGTVPPLCLLRQDECIKKHKFIRKKKKKKKKSAKLEKGSLHTLEWVVTN